MQGIKAPDPFEEHAFEEPVDFYQTSLLRMCYLNPHDLRLAEDAVQETYVKAYRAIPSFRGGSDIKTWLKMWLLFAFGADRKSGSLLTATSVKYEPVSTEDCID